MRYKTLYDTRIAGQSYKTGDEAEFAPGTDELFIRRLVSIGCIEALPETTKEKATGKRGTNIKAKKQEAQDDSLDDIIEDIED